MWCPRAKESSSLADHVSVSCLIALLGVFCRGYVAEEPRWMHLLVAVLMSCVYQVVFFGELTPASALPIQ